MQTYSADDCQEAFVALRNKTLRTLKKTPDHQKEEVAIDVFNDICLDASKNDPIAQDYLAYIFKKGFFDVVPINYERFMQWQILAGASGNQFAIDKLALFLNFAFGKILVVDDIDFLIKRNNLTESNYEYVIGRLLCEAIADELRLDPETLVKQPLEHMEFDPKIMRVFDRARAFVIPKVLKFLRN